MLTLQILLIESSNTNADEQYSKKHQHWAIMIGFVTV